MLFHANPVNAAAIPCSFLQSSFTSAVSTTCFFEELTNKNLIFSLKNKELLHMCVVDGVVRLCAEKLYKGGLVRGILQM